MLSWDKLRFFVGGSGFLQLSIINHLLLFCYILSFSNADMGRKMPELSLPDNNTPLSHKPHNKRSNPFAASAQPPHYGDFASSTPPERSHLFKPSMKKSNIAPAQPELSTLPAGLAQPPLSSNLSNCCGPNMVLKRGSRGCDCVYPIKLDILLSNVSSNPDWKLFLVQFASQLGLRISQIELINFYMVGVNGLNISMDIAPRRGISFSPNQADVINSSLATRKVRFDPALVGDYQLLNFTRFQPPATSLAPASVISPTIPPISQPPSPTILVSSEGPQNPSLILIVGLGALILIIGTISLAIVCFCVSRMGKHVETVKETEKQRNVVECVPTEASLRHPTSTRFLPYEELKGATNNFQPSNLLGEGGFGKVFKGVLGDGTSAAIKRLTSSGQQGGKEFLVEVEMLSRLHHRNLVKLIGYYSNRDSSINLLCYELVPNGNLESWLHGALGVNCALDWDKRMKIALDAARGLAYLHEDCQPCVIHRDFKASNILLENDFHAKVSDFGLAKQAPEGRANHLSTRVMGTFGYVAPEYAMTGHLLVKSDVYSYGVVLLELLTGRKPVDMSQPSGQENLVAWARPILRDMGRPEELADPRLEGKYPKEDFFRVCTIAAACVVTEAHQRPTMGEVMQSLKMVQRVAEYQEFAVRTTITTTSNNNAAANLRQSSTTFESDGTSSSVFSSGPHSGLSALDNENFLRTVALSEDLQEGR